MLRGHLSAFGLAALIALPALAQENIKPAVSNVYVFGDSAVDAGNWNLSPPLEKKDVPYYFRGRWADSYNWADMITMALVGHFSYASGPFTPPYLAAGARFVPQGTNYAYGGAVSGYGPDLSPPYVPSMVKQADGLLTASPRLDPHALYFLSGGGNNFVANSIQPADKQLPDDKVAARAAIDIAAIVRKLADAGARYFLVNVTSEDSRQPPPGGFEEKVSSGLDHVAAENPRIHIVKLDTSAVFRYVADHAAQYRISDPIRSCYTFDLASPVFKPMTYDPRAPEPKVDSPALYTIPGVCKDVTQHLLIDGFHNTAEVQAALAHAALSALAKDLLPVILKEAGE